MTKISVIIPVYNDEQYVEECLLSVTNQTYENLEIICVDDCSTDKSASIIEKVAITDSRIHIIKLTENMGAYTARKYGVNSATGDYIIFLDADDTIDKGLLDEVINMVMDENVDILQFSSNIINSGVDDAIIENMTRFVEPLCEKIYKDDIMTKCFCDCQYGYNIWNKIYRADLCKRVLGQLPEVNIQKANDIFIYFFIAANASSYVGIISHNKYNYFYGRGNTGEREITAKEYLKYCKYSEMIKEINNNIHICNNIMVAESALQKVKTKLLEEAIYIWIFSVKKEEKENAIDSLFASWGMLDILERCKTVFCGQGEILTEYIEKYKIKLIRNIVNENKLKVAIYPYGTQGKRIEKLLKNNDIRAELIVDNNVIKGNRKTITTYQLGQIDVETYLFIICSDSAKYYIDIRETIGRLVPSENIFDWYPLIMTN